ncbi:hypothetical protein FRB95_011731 [Tulasnella sp. JGI-2019a]|nr:hypothetical protein FRB95_011731 [Tulasnella sp. JGI-2019a]
MESILDVGWSYPNEDAGTASQGSKRIYPSIPCHGPPHDIRYPDLQDQLVEEKLYPPDIDMVRKALALLLDSTQRASQAHLSANAFMMTCPQNAGGRMSELVKVACQALIREAGTQSSEAWQRHDANIAAVQGQRDAQAAQVAYRQNTFAPINKLPIEVLSGTLFFASLNECSFDEWRFLSHTETIRRLAMVE